MTIYYKQNKKNIYIFITIILRKYRIRRAKKFRKIGARVYEKTKKREREKSFNLI